MKARHLKQLCAEVVDSLESMDYAPITVTHYKQRFNSFVAYAAECGQDQWSEKLVRDYILNRYGYDISQNERLPPNVTQIKRACWILGFYSKTGDIPVRVTKERIVPARFRPALELYLAECMKRQLSEATLVNRHSDICDFLDFLVRKDVSRLADIACKDIELFMFERHEKSPKAISRIASSLRCFLRCMYSSRITERDLSLLVPKPNRYPRKSVTKVWSAEEISTLMNSINRADAIGKRDYAMLLLVTTYGLRSGDVTGMRLTDLDWKANALRIVQRKTSVPNTLPLTDETGWALADWLRNGRPAQSRCDNVFVRLSAPYEALESVGPILERRRANAGIAGCPNIASGPHSLRHSVATSMLAQDITVPVISSVLGHTHQTTTMVYLHSDIEGLRRCALDLEEVEHGR